MLSKSGMNSFICDEFLYICCIPDYNKLWRLRWLGSDHFVELKILLEDPKSTHDMPNSRSDDPEFHFATGEFSDVGKIIFFDIF